MKPTDYATVNGAARLCDIPRSTIRSAIARGEITPNELADSTTILRLSEIQKWAKTQRKTGRKPRREITSPKKVKKI